jgi:hypothetical protein
VIHCHVCEVEVHPAHDMTPAGVVEVCPRCSAKLAKAPVAEAAIPPAVVRTTALRPASNATDIEAHLRSRLAAVEVELERAAGLKAERTKLRRMLKAAERR